MQDNVWHIQLSEQASKDGRLSVGRGGLHLGSPAVAMKPRPDGHCVGRPCRRAVGNSCWRKSRLSCAGLGERSQARVNPPCQFKKQNSCVCLQMRPGIPPFLSPTADTHPEHPSFLLRHTQSSTFGGGHSPPTPTPMNGYHRARGVTRGVTWHDRPGERGSVRATPTPFYGSSASGRSA